MVDERPRIVFVHGSVMGGRPTWSGQRGLGDRFRLEILERPGFPPNPPVEYVDFDDHAALVAEAVGDGAHLVGHSYGGVIALLAAAQRPEAVHSLTVSEPGALRVACGTPAVDTMIAQGEELYRHSDAIPRREFVALFRAGAQSARETPDVLPDWLERGAAHVMEERPSWEADVPLDALAQAPFRTLVLSGGHSPAFEAVCDTIAQRLGAQRDVIAGRGHTIPSTGAAYNARLEAFLRG